MDSSEFPATLCRFIEETIPALEAVEILLSLSRDTSATFTAGQLAHLIEPATVSEVQAAKYLESFRLYGLVSLEAGRFQYRPASPDLDTLVRQLARVYNERPVTLVRLIYTFKDAKIRSFADAFKIKKE